MRENLLEYLLDLAERIPFEKTSILVFAHANKVKLGSVKKGVIGVYAEYGPRKRIFVDEKLDSMMAVAVALREIAHALQNEIWGERELPDKQLREVEVEVIAGALASYAKDAQKILLARKQLPARDSFVYFKWGYENAREVLKKVEKRLQAWAGERSTD